MFSDQNNLPTEELIAGSTRNLLIYLCVDNLQKQIDATGMTAKFTLTDYINDNAPIVSKTCLIVVPPEESLAIIQVNLVRTDTLDLDGRYIYQVTINDDGSSAVLKGVMNIAKNYDLSVF